MAEKLLKNRRQADILQRRFLGETIQQIGSRYGVTRERIRQLASRYQKYTTDTDSKDWIEKSVRTLIAQNEDEKRLPPNEEIRHSHPRLEYGLVKHFTSKSGYSLTPDCRVEVAENLGLDKEYELINHPTRWNIGKVIHEVRKLARELGKPDLMPMQREMRRKGHQGLSGIISRFGGQAKVADLAGLRYQGQLISPDGSRLYWTDERVKRFLHQVAERNGHPGVMPTQKECREFAPNPNTVVSGVTRAGPGGQSGLTWYETAQKHGLRYQKGDHKITMRFIKAFVKSLGHAIYSLSPAEIYVLFEQQGIRRTGAERTFDNFTEAIQSGFLPREEIEKWINGETGELVEALLDPEIESIEEAFSSVGETVRRKSYRSKDENPSDEPYRENIEDALPVPT